MAPRRLPVRFSNHIRDVDRGSWGALARTTPLADYDWLATLEAKHGAKHAAKHGANHKPCYWWVEDEQGVVAVVVALLMTPDPSAHTLDRERYGPWAPVIGPLRRLFENRPRLVCGSQLAPGNPVLWREELDTEHRRLAGSTPDGAVADVPFLPLMEPLPGGRRCCHFGPDRAGSGMSLPGRPDPSPTLALCFGDGPRRNSAALRSMRQGMRP